MSEQFLNVMTPKLSRSHSDSSVFQRNHEADDLPRVTLLLANSSLALTSSLGLDIPPPSLGTVEGPPSDLDEPQELLIRSSGSFGVSVGARSAPVTPIGGPDTLSLSPRDLRSSERSNKGHGGSQTNSTPQLRSPSHKSDKSLKPLPSPTTAVPVPGGHAKPGGSSKARQKKFHRHFQQVAEEERVINYYSCALVGDFLLQGHLYITNNYFAFYSNVFGFVTKLLIPTASVIKISKEKTARIIPNAVGVATPDEKHVFGSFMSRDSAHRLMLQVWRATQPHEIPIIKGEPEVSECSVEEYSSGSGSGTDCSAIGRERTPVKIVPVVHTLSPLVAAVPSVPDGPIRRTAATVVTTAPEIRAPIIADVTPLKPQVSSVPPRYSFLLIFSTALLTLLFLSAGVLLYRINLVHKIPTQDIAGGDLYSEVLRWQAELHSQSASEVQSVLDSHLHQIAKVRQSLEALSMLIMPEDSQQNKHSGTS